MNYICLCYYDHKKFEATSPADFEQIRRICEPLDASLKESGHLIFVGSLAMPNTAKTIRGGEDNQPYVTDGQYADTNEPIGAIFMIEANDMDEAVKIALKHPGGYVGKYFGGGIEVRAFDHFEEMPRG